MKTEHREIGEKTTLIGRVISYMVSPFKQNSPQQLELFPVTVNINPDETVRLAYVDQQIHNPRYNFPY